LRVSPCSLFLFGVSRPARSPLFPYTTLFRSERLGQLGRLGRLVRSKAALPLSSTPGEPVLFVNLHPLDLVDPEIAAPDSALAARSEEHTSELQSRENLVCRLLLEKKKSS